MNVHRLPRTGDASRIRVVSDEVADANWVSVDLGTTLARLPPSGRRRPERHVWTTQTATTGPWGGFVDNRGGRWADEAAAPARSPDPNAPRIPAGDLVAIGRVQPVLRTTTHASRIWRELFMLGVLALTLAGTYYLGRQQGFTKVIEVPETASRRSAIV